MVSSNLRLLGLGLLIGLLSALYPRLPFYLPQSVSSLLPFLSVQPPLPKTAWTSYQRFQANSPLAMNHDPADEVGPLEERLRRLGTPEGRQKELDREKKELEKEGERRELAGKENEREGREAVWWLVGELKTNPLLPKLMSDLLTLSPKHLIMLGPTSSYQPVLYSPPTPLTKSLQNLLARSGQLSTLQPLPSSIKPPFLLPPEISVVYLGVPDNGTPKQWEEIGEAVEGLRRGAGVVCCFDDEGDRDEGKWGTVPRTLPVNQRYHLHTTLAHHTSHPRLLALSNLSNNIDITPAVWSLIASAGNSEGEELGRAEVGSEYEKDGTGWGWRFGEAVL